ncbi:MAG: hypothetical protein JW955_22805 [Sedimentisphaerales bacterium]|nr:hypothetical protein [Sedimentisphaerales bacterium]
MQRIVILSVILLACSSVFGTTLMGPPAAILGGERFGLSAEYSQTAADIPLEHANGAVSSDFDVPAGYAVFSVAATRWLEFYARLGAARADASDFGGDTNLSWGLGTRLTALEWGDFAWGAMLQFTSMISRFDTMEGFLAEDDSVVPLKTEEELSLVEYDFATGPSWRHDRFCIYGGLLLRYVTGYLDFDATYAWDRFDVDAYLDVGGYLGGTFSLFKSDSPQGAWPSRCDVTVEGRFTGDSNGFSIALLLPFGGER